MSARLASLIVLAVASLSPRTLPAAMPSATLRAAQAVTQPTPPAAATSALPPMAPTALKPGALIPGSQNNAIPPLPGPLPKALANAGLSPAAAALASATGSLPFSAESSNMSSRASGTPLKGLPSTGARPATGAGVPSNLPPGPLSTTPIAISTGPNDIHISGLGSSSTPWSIILLLTTLSLIPSLLICVTPFARLLVVFHFLRQALGLQTTPSNQTLIGLSLILTFFIMQPVGKEIYQQSFVPLQSGELTPFQALGRAEDPLRNFMVHFVREKDAALFLEIAKEPRPHDIHDLSLRVLLPAYIVSELKAGFQIGAVLFLPFLVVDMVVASITTSVGMMQLPPVVISTPLKLLLFLMVDGWHLLIGALMRSFT